MVELDGGGEYGWKTLRTSKHTYSGEGNESKSDDDWWNPDRDGFERTGGEVPRDGSDRGETARKRERADKGVAEGGVYKDRPGAFDGPKDAGRGRIVVDGRHVY
ncbi:MAG: hypothetical protein AAFU70_08980 [Planctomycetota bacterium]